MAKTLSLSGIQTGQAIEAPHVSQSINAFTGAEAYDITISGSLTVQGPIEGTAGTTNNLTSSYAITASYALNAGSGGGGSIGTLQQVMESGSSTTLVITASAGISSSGAIISPSFTGSLLGTATTASYVTTAQTASYVTTAQTASYVLNAVSSSLAQTASFIPDSAKFPFSGSAVITGSLVVSSSNQEQSLQLYGSGSTIFSIEGSRGTLFSIDDDESDGILFSANNISGTPVLEVHEDNTVKLGKQNGFGIVISGSNPLPNDADAKILITGSIYNSGSNAYFDTNISASGYISASEFSGGGSGITGIISSSYALTASFAENVSTPTLQTVTNQGASTTVPITSSIISSSANIIAQSFTGSLLGTSTTASYVENAQTASYVETAQTASYVAASNIDQPFTNLTSSNLLITGTASINLLYTTYESSSIIYSSGSTKFGDTFDDFHQFTGSISSTGSNVDFTNATGVSGSFSGSFEGEGSGITGIISSSYATTASHALNVLYENGTGTNSIKPIASSNTASGTDSSVGGGKLNNASGKCSTIGGGEGNTASGYYSSIIGGKGNTSSGDGTTTSGYQNTNSGRYTTISGYRNTSTFSGRYGIVNGACNTLSGYYSSIAGGLCNTLSGYHSSIVGGQCNTLTLSGCYSSIVGGQCNHISHEKSFVIGSNISSSAACTTHVNNLQVLGNITGSIISASGNILANVTDNSDVSFKTVVYDTTTGQFFRTGSYGGGGGGTGFPFSGSAIITGSLLVSSSNVDFTDTTGVSGSFSGSFEGEGSGITGIISSSYASTASYVENAQTASYVGTALNANDLVVQVKNTQTSTILKGQVLHSTGVTGEVIDVITASNDSAASMPGFAVANQDINSNASGQAIISGKIKDIDTSGLTAGSNVYVDLNGGYTGTKPTGSSLIQNIGIVGKVNATEGELIILGAGRSNDVPNISPGYIWIGNSDSVATPTATSSIQNVISSSYANTASYVENAQTASYITTAQTASYVLNAVSSSYATTASHALNVSTPTLQEVTNEGASTTTPITASIISASNGVTGSLLGNASTATTASFITLAQTASYVTTAQTASYIEKSNIDGLLLSSSAQIASDISGAFGEASASFSTRVTTNETNIITLTLKTGSYATTGSNNFIGDQDITGNITASGNISASGYISASSFNATPGTTNELTASYAITASHTMNIQPENNFMPVVTHTSNFNSEISYAGHYNIVGGNLSITVTTGSTPTDLIPGMEWNFFQTSSGNNFTFTAGTGVNLVSRNAHTKLAAIGSAGTLKYISDQTFHLIGDLTL